MGERGSPDVVDEETARELQLAPAHEQDQFGRKGESGDERSSESQLAGRTVLRTCRRTTEALGRRNCGASMRRIGVVSAGKQGCREEGRART